jgi:NTP pyrophosphatase (non-canonical NTP hydrolase)
MTLQELFDFIALEDKRLNHLFEGSLDTFRRTLARTVKLQEEVGELAGDVLSSLQLQREQKLKNFSHDHLGDELADVLITTLLLSRTLDIDVSQALERKIAKIGARYA